MPAGFSLANLGTAIVVFAVPAEWIRWLGLLPVVLGVRLLVQLCRWQGDDDDDLATERRFKARLHSQIFGVAAIAIGTHILL